MDKFEDAICGWFVRKDGEFADHVVFCDPDWITDEYFSSMATVFNICAVLYDRDFKAFQGFIEQMSEVIIRQGYLEGMPKTMGNA